MQSGKGILVMWPFTSSYPTQRVEDIAGKTYDYVMVGGGTAGCVVASRLSEDPSVSVLVLEKGYVGDHLLTRIPLISQGMTFPFLPSVLRLSEPIGAGRKAKMWSAEALGGSSRINGMLLTRGVPAGYEEWEDEFGLTDWSWERVEPFFRKSENAVGHPEAEHRGHKGPFDNRQVPSYFEGAWKEYIEKTAGMAGLPVQRDLNDPRTSAQGYFYLDMCIDGKGYRLSSYDVWLNRRIVRERKETLTVCTGVMTSRIEFEGTRGTGVYVRARGAMRDHLVKVRREVILCGGALCSPQILMLSGIGTCTALESHGIPIVRDLPAVGQNLSDHVSVPVMMEMPRKDTIHVIQTWLGIIWHLLLYFLFNKGILAGSITPVSVFARTTAIDDTMTVRSNTETDGDTMDGFRPCNIPDFEIMVHPINCIIWDIPDEILFSWFTTIVQPRSRGRVELISTDPETSPKLHYPYMTDELDRVPLRKSLRFTMRLVEDFARSGYPHPTPLRFAPGMDLEYLDAALGLGGKGKNGSSSAHEKHKNGPRRSKGKKLDWRTVTDAEIDAYTERVWISSLHFTSTCRISLTAEDGVVDQRLKVHGLENLRVADASVLPKIPSCHTMAPTVMVAERCADFIKREWVEKK